jgi:hypothetical protein
MSGIHEEQNVVLSDLVFTPFTLDDLIQSVTRLHNQLLNGCGNHGCVIKQPTGIGTNAICRCRPDQIARDLKKLSQAVDRAGLSWKKQG